jgi:hypothetical protein
VIFIFDHIKGEAKQVDPRYLQIGPTRYYKRSPEMKILTDWLDHIPLGTVTHIGGGVIALIAYLNGDLSVFEALAVWGIVGVGAGQIGVARNGSGRGVK